MIGAWSSYTGTFLGWFPLLIMLVFGLPMLIAPMAWGRIIGFRLPENTDLAVSLSLENRIRSAGSRISCGMLL